MTDLKKTLLPVLLSLILFQTSCGDRDTQGKKKGDKPQAPVTAALAVKKIIPVDITGTGHVEAGASIRVFPRVSGTLLSVHFKEGAEVRKGELLFSIDDAPFKARLRQAEADLERDRAKRRLAAAQVKRYGSLSDKGYLSAEEYEQLQNDLAVLNAQIRADEAVVDSAKLDLSYCSIRAEITGITGEINVDPGNLVTTGSTTPLTTLRSVKDLDVSISVPEKHFREIRSAMAHGSVRVAALADGDLKPLAQGILTFIDNTIDAESGMVLLKAGFGNDGKTLWPGQFVRVTVELPVSEEGITVPNQAIQTGQKGSFVYILHKDMKVESRAVETGRSFNGDTLIVRGVSEGEKVVVEGQLKLSDGATVKVVEPGGGNEKNPTKADRP